MREELAEYAHNAWAGWMKYLFEKSAQNADGTVTIPVWAVIRWRRQMNTQYKALPEGERESDRLEADKMLAILEPPNTASRPPAPVDRCSVAQDDYGDWWLEFYVDDICHAILVSDVVAQQGVL